jgi:hypothetical protein
LPLRIGHGLGTTNLYHGRGHGLLRIRIGNGAGEWHRFASTCSQQDPKQEQQHHLPNTAVSSMQHGDFLLDWMIDEMSISD